MVESAGGIPSLWPSSCPKLLMVSAALSLHPPQPTWWSPKGSATAWHTGHQVPSSTIWAPASTGDIAGTPSPADRDLEQMMECLASHQHEGWRRRESQSFGPGVGSCSRAHRTQPGQWPLKDSIVREGHPSPQWRSSLPSLQLRQILESRCQVSCGGRDPAKDSSDQLLGLIQRADVGSRGMEGGLTDTQTTKCCWREAFSRTSLGGALPQSQTGPQG